MGQSISAAQLPQVLDTHGQGIRLLSLDCFDTLLWRSTATPADLFAELDAGIRCRVRAEATGRARKQLAENNTEVTLHEIHRCLAPDAEDGEIARSVAAELAAEARNCFAFAPTVALIRSAHERGIPVIVVSDTYLDEAQLRGLIAAAAGPELLAMIARVYCSSHYGVSKTGGLFHHVLNDLKVPADSVLHVGDNYQADMVAASDAGLRAIHLIQFERELDQQMRLEASCALVFDPKLRVDRAIQQMHRATLALHWSELPDPAQRVGFGTLGPILHGFAHWILAQAEELAQSRNVNLLFLLRDGHMPLQAFRQLPGSERIPHAAVELSRFASYAASFDDEASVIAYLADLGSNRRFDALANQLLFEPSEVRELKASADAAPDPMAAFVALVRQPANLRKIIERSQAYRLRLFDYLRHTGKVHAGQTLVLVDLGYAGTVQDRLAPLLRKALSVEVLGRYLLLRDVPGWRRDKLGFLGPDSYDSRSLDALADYVAIVEQLCTLEQASVVDYDEWGAPVRKHAERSAGQNRTRSSAQAAGLRYIQCYPGSFYREPATERVDALRTSACLSLSRLLYLPSSEEARMFDGFEHDVNMGVEDTVRLFDPRKAREGMIAHGLFYTNKQSRQFLPAEVRQAGMPASLSVMMLRRFSPDLRYPDFESEQMVLPIMIADATSIVQRSVTAVATHDGYFTVTVPIGARKLSVGLSLGHVFEWVQIETINMVPLAELMTAGESRRRIDLLEKAVYEDIERSRNGLMHCASAHSFLFVPSGIGETDEPWALSVVFRPIAVRAGAQGAYQQQGELIAQTH